MPGIIGSETSSVTSAFATTPPCVLLTRPFTDDVCAEAAEAAKRITTLATATRNLCMFITFMTEEDMAAHLDNSDRRVDTLDIRVDISASES